MSVSTVATTSPEVPKTSVLRGVVIVALVFEFAIFCALGWAV